MKNFTLLTLLMFSNSVIFSQQWTIRYNGTGNGDDAIKSMVTDNAGNVYVTGSSYSGGSNYDYMTIKYNSSGVQQWKARYNGPPGTGTDQGNAIFVDNSGNVYVTGFSYQQPFYGNMDVATVKYNAQGVQQWATRFDGIQQRADAGTAVKADAAGNVYVAGWTTDTHASYARKDYLIIKYNSSGVQQWVATYNGPGNKDDVPAGIGLDGSGNVYVSGTSYAGEYVGQNDFVTIKYSPQGVQQWIVRYNGAANGYDYANAIAVDDLGNAYVTGSTLGAGTDQDYTTIKYNSKGVQQWLKSYDGPGHGYDIAHSIALDNSGNVYVTGESQSTAFKTDYCTVKYNSSGVRQWTARFNGTANDNDVANVAAVDGTGNAYITGYINGLIEKWNMATVKYSASGIQQWVKIYDGPAHNSDAGYGAGVDGNGNVYVAGSSTGTASGLDYITIKYGSATTSSIASMQEEKLQQISLGKFTLQNYPNPFKISTKIKFNIPSDEHVKLVVYNMQGNKIATLVNARLKAGNYEIEWAAGNLLPGSYFYKLSSREFEVARKMVLMR
jgi:Beta-propeller repeat/Secretion system C-terminal sorting domain